MNRKIPFHELAALLANNCNITPEEAEEFIKNFFDLTAQTLTKGETVKIKGIGTFTPSGDAANPVNFTPDAEIADTINAPFALFEPETLSDTLSDEDLATISSPSESEEVKVEADEPKPEIPETAENNATDDVVTVNDNSEEAVEETAIDEKTSVIPSEPVAKQEIATESAAVQEPAAETAAGQETVAEAENKPVPPAVKPPVTPVKPVPTFPEEEPEEYYHEPEAHRGGPGFGWGFLIGILAGLALGACGVYLAIDHIFPTVPAQTVIAGSEEADDAGLEAIMAEATALTDSGPQPDTTATHSTEPATPAVQPSASAPAPASEQENKPEPKPVIKDTVRPGYLLNDMAKKHYGNKCFWVYIYEENKSKIANPNRVSPGLVLVIPPADKYGINPSARSSIKAANEKAGKILSKYPR